MTNALEGIKDTDEYEKKYEKVKKLGEGCHGYVYEVKEKRTGERYAAKFIESSDEEIQIQI